MLILNHFKGFHQYKYQGGHDFRASRIWSLDMDDLMKANLDSIKKLYSFFTKGTTVLNLTQCLEIGPYLDLSIE
jgi:hypothetical protein